MSKHVPHRDAVNLVAELNSEVTRNVEFITLSVDPEAELNVVPAVASEIV